MQGLIFGCGRVAVHTERGGRRARDTWLAGLSCMTMTLRDTGAEDAQKAANVVCGLREGDRVTVTLHDYRAGCA